MKRTASGEPHPKKAKLDLNSNVLFDDLERNADDLLVQCPPSGYLSCVCFMAWRPTKKHKAILEAIGTAPRRARFEVEFTGTCVDFFPEIELKARDEFLLSLKGARVEKTATLSRLCNLPIKLVYEEGVVVKFTKRRGECQIIDTWQLQENSRQFEDSWFLSPQLPKSLDTEVRTVSTTHSPPATPSTPPEMGGSPTVVSCCDQVVLPPPAPQSPDRSAPVVVVEQLSNLPQLTKKQRKRLKKEEKARQLASRSAAPAIVSVHEPDPVTTNVQQSSTSAFTVSTKANDAVHSVLVPLSTPENPTLGKVVPHGCTITFKTDIPYQYHPLNNDIRQSMHCNLIGVVVHITAPKVTRSGDWSCNVKIVDPSNTEVDNLNAHGSFQINCFTKRYERWLPQPSLGEILILRDVKLTDYQGTRMGVGYHDRLQWAVYSPSIGAIRNIALGSNPSSEGLADGFGHENSPFFQPEEAVIQYSMKLADWWREVENHKKSVEAVHQVGGPNGNQPVFVHSRPVRQHRLISEAGPDVQPSGYFDCTVEVMHGYMNDNGVYSLYVTDYTANLAVAPVQAEWCPPGLADCILKIEVWDAAVPTAQNMFAGEYYSIKNARMTISRGGYVEGKLVEEKARKLDEEDDVQDLHFNSLLGRKKAWKDLNGGDDHLNEFEYNTIGAVSIGKHFNCVLEVLHVAHGDGVACIFVTDYTYRDELRHVKLQNGRGAGLEGHILKISLFNNQMEMAKTIEVGSFYTIKKLRLKQSTTSHQFQGTLGGMERLILLLNPRSTDDRLGELKRRKQQWERSLEVCKEDCKLEPPKNVPQDGRQRRTIEDLKADKNGPNKSRILARVVDFRPWDLSDAVIINCSNCKADVPQNLRACRECNDQDHDFVRYKFQMYLLLQDDAGSQLYVWLHDGSSIFDGLERTSAVENVKALRNRLSQMFGDLLIIHEGPFPEDKSSATLPNTPMLSLIIDSWDADGRRAFCLAKCEDLLD